MQPYSSPPKPTVHPRACGERFTLDLRGGGGTGSSPRVRGTGAPLPPGGQARRFIPARAGNGSFAVSLRQAISVHPRACGERRAELDRLRNIGGSSPRVRGTVRILDPLAHSVRFIPARAGNGFDCGDPHGVSPVHPRACGERSCSRSWPARTCGSSPRVRGTVRLTGESPICYRFILARAGNGRVAALDLVTAPVHPRACGEREAGRIYW